jgi:hypothetical protein
MPAIERWLCSGDAPTASHRRGEPGVNRLFEPVLTQTRVVGAGVIGPLHHPKRGSIDTC